MTEKPRCTALTRKGKPCKATPLKGAGVCLAHADAETREKAGFIPNNGKGGRKPNPKPLEVLREKVEAEIDTWLQPYVDALTATRALVVGNGPEAHLEEAPDHPTRVKAADAVLDRIYGRPKQTTELTGEGGGPIETRELIPTNVDFHTEVAQVIAEAEAAAGSGADQA